MTTTVVHTGNSAMERMQEVVDGYDADSASANNALYVVEVATARAALGLAQDGQTEKAEQLAAVLESRGWTVSGIATLTDEETYTTYAKWLAGGAIAVVLLLVLWLGSKLGS